MSYLQKLYDRVIDAKIRKELSDDFEERLKESLKKGQEEDDKKMGENLSVGINATLTGCEVAEGIHGTWSYHWRKKGEFKSLCGKPIMSTEIPNYTWGTKSHLRERYCEKCSSILETLPYIEGGD